MDKDIFQKEYSRRYYGTNLQISPAANGKDFIISNDAASKAFLVSIEFSCLDGKTHIHERKPAPFLNAEAVVFFRFSLADVVYPPDFIVLIYENPVFGRTDFLIFPREKFKAQIEEIPLRPGKGGFYNLLLWIFRDNFVFVASDLSGEGEWYLLGGLQSGGDCMAKGGERDFSDYLNKWNNFS
jgi:hypothetical protein